MQSRYGKMLMGGISAITALGFVTLCDAQPQGTTDQQQVEAAMRQHWSAYSGKNIQATKQNLAWPCSFLEVTGDRTGSTFSYATEKVWEEEQKKIANTPEVPQEFRQKGEREVVAFTVTPSQMKVQMSNPQLAQVSYKGQVTLKTRGFDDGKIKSSTYVVPMLTILHKQQDANARKWKIVFSTVPE